LKTPDFAAPGRPFALYDLRYRAGIGASASQSFFARVKVGDFGLLSAGKDAGRRELALQTHRVALGFFDDGSFTNLQAGVRSSRVLFDVQAERLPPQDGHAWTFNGELGVRLTNDLEAFVDGFSDTHPGRARPERELRSLGGSLLWQRGTRLDLSLGAAYDERRTLAGFDLPSTRAFANASGYSWNGEAQATVACQRTRGALPRNEVDASLALQTTFENRVLLEGHSDNRWEPGVLWFEHEAGAGVSLHARRVRMARAGESAARTLALTRRANALGENERRVYDDDGRRALRERLALSPRRAELAEELQQLYRAQVEERRAPLLGAAYAERSDRVAGSHRRGVDAFIGLPWPVHWPWQPNEAAVPFLTLRYARGWNSYDGGLSSKDQRAALSAALNRELSIEVRWRRPALTPLDVIRRTGGGASWEVEAVYARGR
jgi:hypothetical protein